MTSPLPEISPLVLPLSLSCSQWGFRIPVSCEVDPVQPLPHQPGNSTQPQGQRLKGWLALWPVSHQTVVTGRLLVWIYVEWFVWFLYLRAIRWFFGSIRNMKYLNPPLVHISSLFHFPTLDPLLSPFSLNPHDYKRMLPLFAVFRCLPVVPPPLTWMERPSSQTRPLKVCLCWCFDVHVFSEPTWNSIWKALELQLGFQWWRVSHWSETLFFHNCDIQAFKNISLKQLLGIRQLLGGCEAWSLAKIASQKRSSETLREKRKSVCVIILPWPVYSIHWLELNP